MTDPQTNLSDVPETEQPPPAPAAGTARVPDPDELNRRDGAQGAAVGDLPTDENPADLDEGRRRTGWDTGTDPERPQD